MLLDNGTLYTQVKVVGIKKEVAGVKTFTISGLETGYAAGQFLTLVFAHNGEELRRSYSFSSSPGIDQLHAFTVKRVENGIASRILYDTVQVGDTLYTTGVSGFFTLPEAYHKLNQVFFFAAGVGITPVYSLLKSLLANNAHVNVVLIYSNRATGETIFYDELQKLQQQYAERFKIEYLFSTAKKLDKARLNKALLPVLLNSHLQHNISNTLFYLCGPYPYMRMVIMALEEYNIPAENIRRENFNTDSVIGIQRPPDVARHNIRLNLKGAVYNFETEYPDTILKAAKRQGIPIPYSCENGICGSCVARCTLGTVWHRNNEVLTDEELAKGLILTCVGYPIHGDAGLEIV